MSEAEDSDYLETFVLPALVGIVLTIAGSIISFIVDKAEQRRAERKEKADLKATVRKEQMERALKLCEEITESMDLLFASMKHQAWPVAWRKAHPVDENKELESPDKKDWEEYNKCLWQWLKHKVGFETQLQSFFGEESTVAKHFRHINSLFIVCSYDLWNLYFSSSKNSYMIRKESGVLLPIIELRTRDREETELTTIKDNLQINLKELHAKLNNFSKLMQEGIQNEDVGTLRKKSA